MVRFFAKPYRWAACYALLLVAAFTFVLLDTFVIPKARSVVPTEPEVAQVEPTVPSEPVVTANSYQDEDITITIDTVREHDTTYYVADIQLADASYLQTALANNTYGRNIKQTTSAMAAAHAAIFAINGDYYGFRNSGYVLRNGVLYRDVARTAGDDEALVIDTDGDFSIIQESRVSLRSLQQQGVRQAFSFGPALVEDGQIAVDRTSEVSKSKGSNPRTAIGQVSQLHYVIIVSDGRTDESEGLSLLELAQAMAARGCTTAYNLDGGGSSTMYFSGKIVNNPTDGRSIQERKVSDIVYIAAK